MSDAIVELSPIHFRVPTIIKLRLKKLQIDKELKGQKENLEDLYRACFEKGVAKLIDEMNTSGIN